jgi:hypothetical protein
MTDTEQLTEIESSKQQVWGEIVELGILGFAAMLSAKKGKDMIIDKNRSDFLEHLPVQNLSRINESKVRSYFRKMKFYVTQFPETPAENFPEAVKILYNLLKYLGAPSEQRGLRNDLKIWLGRYRLQTSTGETLKFEKDEIFFILNRSRQQKNTLDYFLNEAGWGLLAEQSKKIQLTNRNGEEVQNNRYCGLLIVKLFGMLSGKRRIDADIFEAKNFGKVGNKIEWDQTRTSLSEFQDYLQNGNWVVHVFDMPAIKHSTMAEEIEEIFKIEGFQTLIDNWKGDYNHRKKTNEHYLPKILLKEKKVEIMKAFKENHPKYASDDRLGKLFNHGIYYLWI